MSVINYAIELTTEKTQLTNQAYGLVAGVFRWVTGRPTYDGVTTIPKNEDGTDNTNKWYTNILMLDSIKGLSRSIDISETGDYGANSSVSFSIRNDQLVWEYVYLNKIYFTNRKIQVYTVIDDVFYPIWSGVVSKNPIEEIDYVFNCQDNYKNLHKMIPPEVVSITNFAQSDEGSQGAVIPVSIGDVTYAKLQVVSNANDTFTLVNTPIVSDKLYQIKSAYALQYLDATLTTPATLYLYTPHMTIADNQFMGSYLYPTLGGGNCNEDQLVRVRSNMQHPTNPSVQIVELEDGLEGVNAALFNKKYAYDPNNGIVTQSYYAINLTIQDNCYVDYVAKVAYQKDILLAWDFYIQGINLSNNASGTNLLRFHMYNGHPMIMYVWDDAAHTNLIGEYIFKDDATIKQWVDIDVPLIDTYYSSNTTLYFRIQPGSPGATTQIFQGSQLQIINPMHTVPTADTWAFSILSMHISRIVSTNKIKEYQKDLAGKPILYTYNDAKGEMEVSPSILIDSLVGSDTEYPSFKVVPNKMNSSGSAIYQSSITPVEWQVIIPRSGYITLPDNSKVRSITSSSKWLPQINICDRNHDTSLPVFFADTTENTSNIYKIKIKLVFPADHTKVDWDNLYAAVDLTATSLNTNDKLRMFGNFTTMSPYGEPLNDEDDVNSDGAYTNVDPVFYYPLDEEGTTYALESYCLPTDYFFNGGKRDDKPSLWSLVGENADGEDEVLKTLFELPNEVVSALKSGTTANAVQLNLYIACNEHKFLGDVVIKEVGFVGVRSVNPTSDDLYVRLSGELLPDDTESNTVYGAFRLMLETYDRIPSNQIDYTNLPLTRSDWSVGRQLMDRQSSYNYLIELARQSFVGIYPTRSGKRGLRAWRDPYLSETTVVDVPIIAGSINTWMETDIANLYNELQVWYAYNDASSKYSRSILIKNADESAFPPITDDSWKSWVGGLSGSTYTDSKKLWEALHYMYVISHAVQELPSSMSNLSWFTNDNLFNGLPDVGASVTSSAMRYVNNCVYWLSRQKTVVSFSTILTADVAKIELLQRCKFNDPIYTANYDRYGWVTGIDINTTECTAKLTYTLEPLEDVIDNLVIERGTSLNVDEREETSTAEDNFEDGQGRI